MNYNFEISALKLTQSIDFEKQPYIRIFGIVNPTDLEILIDENYALYPNNKKLEKKYSKKDSVKVEVCFLRDELVRKSVGNNIGSEEIVGVGFFHEDGWTTKEPTLLLQILLSEENMGILMSNILAKNNPTNLGITIINSPFEVVEFDYVWKQKSNDKKNPTLNMLEIYSANLTYSN